MEYDGGKEPLLTEEVEPKPQINSMVSTKSRKLRRCRSAPNVEPILVESNMFRFMNSPQSIFDQVNPHFKRVAIYLSIYLLIGTVCFYLSRNQIVGVKTYGIVDSIYFCIVTMTTVGYGDILPNSITTKLLSCAFVFSGMALIGLSLSKAADCLVENQEILLVKALHLRQKANSMEILKEMETNRVRYRCIIFSILLALLIASGTIFLTTVEKMKFVDAFYCVCSTITTLGYGDKSFSTLAGRIFAIFWIMTSTICLAQLLFAFAELYTESRQRSLARWVLTRRTTVADLEAADLDDDGVVGVIDFVNESVKTLAGNGTKGSDYRGGGIGVSQLLNSPWDVCFEPVNHSVYIAMAGQHQIWEHSTLDGVTKAFSGDGYERNLNGPSSLTTSFAQPSGLSLSPDSKEAYIADSESSSIRALNLKTGGSRLLVGGDPVFSDNLFKLARVFNNYKSLDEQSLSGIIIDEFRNATGLVAPVAAEFVIFKLKEMGKINQEDISLILAEFKNLDVDESGTLSTSDIFLAQSSRKER